MPLPTFAREYEKGALACTQDQADYPRYLLRLCELERIDRDRRNIERRIRQAKFPQTKSLDTFDFQGDLESQQTVGAGAGALRMDRAAGELHWARSCRHRQDAHGVGIGPGGLPEEPYGVFHDGAPRWSMNCWRHAMNGVCARCKSNWPG